MPENENEKVEKSITINANIVKSVIGAIVAIAGATIAMETHFATAADVEQMQRGIESQVRQIRQERVEDELFKLDIKKQQQGGKLDPVEQALYERYARRMAETRAAEEKATMSAPPLSRGIMSFIK
jgi:hypothetical protein